MDDKEKRNIEINMGFVIIAEVLGIFLSIFSNAIYDLLTNKFSYSKFFVLLGSSLLTLLFVEFVSFLIELPKDKKTRFISIFYEFLKSLIKTKKENKNDIIKKVITKKIDTIWFEEILAGRKKVELRLADFDVK